jgi:hypothetical protein
VKLDAAGAVTSTEERPNVPPGHHKKDKPLKERKPGVRTS